jgi:site-specific DNA recombinase
LEVAFKSFMAAEYVRDLSAKTKRGMRANAEAGKATGSRTARGGAQEIVEAEANIIRRIFADDVAGDTARTIAAALNRESILDRAAGSGTGPASAGPSSVAMAC